MSRPYPSDRARAIMDVQVAVAEISGGMSPDDFTPATWKMLCAINVKLCEMAIEAMS